MGRVVDAVVIGAGPNGLVAANDLADAGWDVLVLEAEPEPGGAVRSAESTEPGFVTDRFSAFYPLGIVSPHLQRLELERWGLQWSHAPSVLGHPTVDGPGVVLDRDLEVTMRSLDRFSPGDGEAWASLFHDWTRVERALIDALMRPFPPVRPALRLVSELGVRGTGDLVRRLLLPVRRLADEVFAGAGGGLLLGGSALHGDLTPEVAAGGLFGWLLTGIGQRHGWPVPRTGSGALTTALVRRLDASGGVFRCDNRVTRIEVEGARAVAVHTEHGERIEARRAVVADVVAPVLYEQLVDRHAVPEKILAELFRYQRGLGTFKVNWTLDGDIPWTDETMARCGTVHLAASLDELTMSSAQLATGHLPEHPFVLIGQMTTADPTRSPTGTQSLWAYTSVPQEIRGDAGGRLAGVESIDDAAAFTRRIEDRVELFAPGFRGRVRRCEVQTPASMQREDANLLNGDKSLGTAQLHQQLVFRPTLGWARAETPVPGLFLASASAHPGGAVHGACGANAARAAIAADRRARFRHGAGRLLRGQVS